MKNIKKRILTKELETLLYDELSNKFVVFFTGIKRVFLKIHTYAYLYSIISIFVLFGLKYEKNEKKLNQDLVVNLIEGIIIIFVTLLNIFSSILSYYREVKIIKLIKEYSNGTKCYKLVQGSK
jgi:hypothetical protein